MTTPAMRAFLAERARHGPTCSLRDAQRWLAARELLDWHDRAKPVTGYGLVCVECAGILDPEPTPEALQPTPSEVRAARDAHRSAGEPYGYPALAKEFHSTPSTIRRRLGVLK